MFFRRKDINYDTNILVILNVKMSCNNTILITDTFSVLIAIKDAGNYPHCFILLEAV